MRLKDVVEEHSLLSVEEKIVYIHKLLDKKTVVTVAKGLKKAGLRVTLTHIVPMGYCNTSQREDNVYLGDIN